MQYELTADYSVSPDETSRSNLTTEFQCVIKPTNSYGSRLDVGQLLNGNNGRTCIDPTIIQGRHDFTEWHDDDLDILALGIHPMNTAG